MTTQVLATDTPDHLKAALTTAVALLRKGQPVALPTETVYGLAADALDAEAAASIFEAKARPLYDPLIVHLPSREWLERLTVREGKVAGIVDRLIAKFWPGPLTLVLPRRDIVPDIVTAGQETVAVRMSRHPVFTAVCEAFGKPLAAPSANRFGRISPTTARHVLEELEGRIPLIVDGGPCAHGIESTIVQVDERGIAILREGPITREELLECGTVISGRSREVVPGSLKSHYAPRTPLVLLGEGEISPSRCGYLAWKQDGKDYKKTLRLSERLDLREAAANLYAAMRTLDESGVETIVVEPVPETGIGKAIMERLRKAAHRE